MHRLWHPHHRRTPARHPRGRTLRALPGKGRATPPCCVSSLTHSGPFSLLSPFFSSLQESRFMSTFHAVVWMDQGKADDLTAFFADVAQALADTREVLLAGPGLVRNQFRDWAAKHHAAVADVVVDSVAADHPTDAQLVAMARQYFKKFDNMAADPSVT